MTPNGGSWESPGHPPPSINAIPVEPARSAAVGHGSPETSRARAHARGASTPTNGYYATGPGSSDDADPTTAAETLESCSSARSLAGVIE
jgi:hypothetical protein